MEKRTQKQGFILLLMGLTLTCLLSACQSTPSRSTSSTDADTDKEIGLLGSSSESGKSESEESVAELKQLTDTQNRRTLQRSITERF